MGAGTQVTAADHPGLVTLKSDLKTNVNAPVEWLEVIPVPPPGIVEPHQPPAGKPPMVPPLPLLISGDDVLGPSYIYKASQFDSVLNDENVT